MLTLMAMLDQTSELVDPNTGELSANMLAASPEFLKEFEAALNDKSWGHGFRMYIILYIYKQSICIHVTFFFFFTFIAHFWSPIMMAFAVFLHEAAKAGFDVPAHDDYVNILLKKAIDKVCIYLFLPVV